MFGMQWVRFCRGLLLSRDRLETRAWAGLEFCRLCIPPCALRPIGNGDKTSGCSPRQRSRGYSFQMSPEGRGQVDPLELEHSCSAFPGSCDSPNHTFNKKHQLPHGGHLWSARSCTKCPTQSSNSQPSHCDNYPVFFGSLPSIFQMRKGRIQGAHLPLLHSEYRMEFGSELQLPGLGACTVNPLKGHRERGHAGGPVGPLCHPPSPSPSPGGNAEVLCWMDNKNQTLSCCWKRQTEKPYTRNQRKSYLGWPDEWSRQCPPSHLRFGFRELFLFLYANTENVYNFLLTAQKFTAACDCWSGHGCHWGKGWWLAGGGVGRWTYVLVQFFWAPAFNLDQGWFTRKLWSFGFPHWLQLLPKAGRRPYNVFICDMIFKILWY